MRLELRDRLLYHQIHPVKLAVDWTTAFGASALFWQHREGSALLLGFVPSIATSVVLVNRVNLERLRNSALGAYVGRFMTRRVEAARFLGLVPLWGGAWRHAPWVMASGVTWIVACWAWGLVRASSAPSSGRQ